MLVPHLVSELTGKFVTKVEAGESSFAMNDAGELFVWGFYNQKVFTKPFTPSTVPGPVKSVSQSFYGVSSIIDSENRLWIWDSKSQNSQDLLCL